MNSESVKTLILHLRLFAFAVPGDYFFSGTCAHTEPCKCVEDWINLCSRCLPQKNMKMKNNLRFRLAGLVEPMRLTASGKCVKHAPHAYLIVVRRLLARAPLTA